jgi:hypothetical protein
MSTVELERLRAIKNFPSLVKYLRDELEWPVKSENFDDLIFDYDPEELGVDAKSAVKVKEIRQLRPLVTGQPWGIFFLSTSNPNGFLSLSCGESCASWSLRSVNLSVRLIRPPGDSMISSSSPPMVSHPTGTSPSPTSPKTRAMAIFLR